MLLVSGGTKTFRPILEERTDVFGTLATPLDGNSLPSIGQWAADNSAYNGPKSCPRCSAGRIYVCGTHSDKREQKFVAMLQRHRWARERCLFVACPDVVADHARTLELFEKWAPRLAADGWPLAFVLQDGCDAARVPWDRIAAVFVGGTNRFKLSPEAAHICAQAQDRGLWCHMGRVTGRGRIRYAAVIGCDSTDGSAFGRFGDEMLLRRGVAAIFRDMSVQRRLGLDGLREKGQP